MNMNALLGAYCADLEEAAMVFWLRLIIGTPWEGTIENALDRMSEAYWQAEYDTVVNNTEHSLPGAAHD